MLNLISATPLYNFLKYCNASKLEKNVLDCGAGGGNPPLSLFEEFGYEVYGIENSQAQIEKAKEFENSRNVNLNLVYGDMLDLPFDNESFSFVFSYNTSVHMKKEDFEKAINEIYRVMKKDGLCFVNFLSEDCDTFGNGREVSDGEYISNDDSIRYSHYKKEEIMKMINGFDQIFYEQKTTIRYMDGNGFQSGFYDLILKKK